MGCMMIYNIQRLLVMRLKKYGGKRRGIRVLVPSEVLPPKFHSIAPRDKKERTSSKGITIEILSKFRKQVNILRKKRFFALSIRVEDYGKWVEEMPWGFIGNWGAGGGRWVSPKPMAQSAGENGPSPFFRGRGENRNDRKRCLAAGCPPPFLEPIT